MGFVQLTAHLGYVAPRPMREVKSARRAQHLLLLLLVLQGQGRMGAVVVLDVLLHVGHLLLDPLARQAESYARRAPFFQNKMHIDDAAVLLARHASVARL